jgi:ankyrin repeat protein
MLQYAASEGKLELVKILVEAGADVNQVPPSLGDEREPGPYRALWMAVNASYCPVEIKHIDTARFLLENGADMNLPARPGELAETALQAARRKGNEDLLVLLEEFRTNQNESIAI